MGVYDHMARPSMGHKLQVELRDSMERYHSDKEYLQTHLGKLRFHSRDLHTSPQPLTPEVPVKKWGEPGSRFSQAPDVAAHKARLAQLQQENSNVSAHHTHTAPTGNKSTLLPPISDKATTDDKAKPETTGAEESQSQADKSPASKGPAGKAGAVKTTGQSVQTKKVSGFKGRKLQKKVVVKKGAVARDKMLPVLKLPTIYSATPRRSMWDSGKQHLLVQGPSTHLEKNQVDEECRNFSQRSMTIPAIMDGKRTEIQRPLGTWNKASTKVQFRRHPPHPHHQEAVSTTVADPTLPPQPRVDHFPRNTPRLPELDDASTDDGQSDDGTVDSQEPGQRPLLPPIPVSTMSSSLHQSAGLPVPPLRLQPGMTSSAMSTATARTGATGATYMSLMSQETQEWKGAYMTTDDPHYKSRMLMEILHATRQRMQDNAEDMRLAGDLPHPADTWSMEGRSEVMLLHRDGAMASEATTARSSMQQQKPLKLPHHIKKHAGGRQENQNSKLHRYLNKLSHQRSKGGGREQPQPQHRHAPFQLATMTIREITQSSMEHSALQTAS